MLDHARAKSHHATKSGSRRGKYCEGKVSVLLCTRFTFNLSISTYIPLQRLRASELDASLQRTLQSMPTCSSSNRYWPQDLLSERRQLVHPTPMREDAVLQEIAFLTVSFIQYRYTNQRSSISALTNPFHARLEKALVQTSIRSPPNSSHHVPLDKCSVRHPSAGKTLSW